MRIRRRSVARSSVSAISCRAAFSVLATPCQTMAISKARPTAMTSTETLKIRVRVKEGGSAGAATACGVSRGGCVTSGRAATRLSAATPRVLSIAEPILEPDSTVATARCRREFRSPRRSSCRYGASPLINRFAPRTIMDKETAPFSGAAYRQVRHHPRTGRALALYRPPADILEIALPWATVLRRVKRAGIRTPLFHPLYTGKYRAATLKCEVGNHPDEYG